MIAVVSGANGYIGSKLAKELLLANHEVIAISRQFSEYVKKELEGAIFISMDIMTDEFKNLSLKADYFFHLASANDIVSKDFEKGVNLSLIGSKNAIELCIKNNIANFIFFSTLQVLGTELSDQYNNSSTHKIESFYAYNHYIAEEYLKMMALKSNLNGIVVRPANIYGAMMDKSIERWSLVPNCFCKEGVEKGSITLLSSGKQNRNFLSLSDLSKLTIRIAEKFKTEKFKVFNLGFIKTFTILEIAKFTKEVFLDEFQCPIDLKIKSEKPISTNDFKIDTSEYIDLMFDFEVNEFTFKTEIKNIINLIK
jgi:UDP-glucose 4-epimerase